MRLTGLYMVFAVLFFFRPCQLMFFNTAVNVILNICTGYKPCLNMPAVCKAVDIKAGHIVLYEYAFFNHSVKTIGGFLVNLRGVDIFYIV